MGDAITTPFDVFLFVLVFVGIPALIFGGPIAVLGFLSVRRTVQLNRNHSNDTDPNSPNTPLSLPWLVALFLSVVVAAIAVLAFGASINQALMLF